VDTPPNTNPTKHTTPQSIQSPKTSKQPKQHPIQATPQGNQYPKPTNAPIQAMPQANQYPKPTNVPIQPMFLICPHIRCLICMCTHCLICMSVRSIQSTSSCAHAFNHAPCVPSTPSLHVFHPIHVSMCPTFVRDKTYNANVSNLSPRHQPQTQQTNQCSNPTRDLLTRNHYKCHHHNSKACQPSRVRVQSTLSF